MSDSESLGADIEAALLEATAPLPPPATLRDKVIARARASMPASNAITLTAMESWLPLNDKIDIKLLFVDETADSVSFLLRAAAGAFVPEHNHSHYEECLVLQGHIQIDELTLGPGDYHCVGHNQSHPKIFTQTGALVYLRTAIRDCPVPL